MANGDNTQQQYTPQQIAALVQLAQNQNTPQAMAVQQMIAQEPGGQVAQALQNYQRNFQKYPQMLNATMVPGTQVSLGQMGQALQAFGGQQQQGGPQAPPPDTSYPLYATNAQGQISGAPAGYANATDQMGMLGAAALNMPYVQNPSPQQPTPGGSGGVGKYGGGVAPVGGALIGSSVPQVGNTWQSVGQGAGLSQADINAFQQQGLTPDQIAKRFGVTGGPLTGPQTTNAGIFAANPRLAPSAGLGAGASGITPTIPANAAGMAGAQTPMPWATAPAAPGVQIPQIPPAVHTSALADAGKALYAHLGGDPATATPGQIAHFHTQLTTNIIPSAVAQYTAGANTVGAPAAPVKKMQFGGLVPGRGNRDTVPALLTHGEYVIPKQQVLRMGSGGFVPDNQDNQDRQPSEARRRRLATAAQSQGTSGNQAASSSQDQGSSAPPAAPGSLYTGPSAAQIRAQNQAAGGNIDNLGRLEDEGLIGSMGIGSGPGSGMPTQQATGVIGGLFSGLASAADAYAKSIGSWQMKPQAFSSRAPQYQVPNLQEEQV